MTVSLVMATYNGEKFLREQLDSIYSQTQVPDEVIVVDDCSKDNTVAILQEYKDSRGLVYMVNEKNKGVNKNFEKAISLASGDYICISDQDDVWKKDKVEISIKKLKEIENDSPACVSSQAEDVDGSLSPIHSNKRYPKDSCWEGAIYGYGSQGCTLFFNKKMKDLILPLSPYFIYDHFIGLLSCFVGNRYCLGTPLMLYRHHGGNVVANKIHKYHSGMSEAMAIYQIMSNKERFWLLQHIVKDYNEKIQNEDKEILLRRTLDYYDCQSTFQMIKRVLTNSYFSWNVRLCFLVFMLILCFKPNRRIVSISDPVANNRTY